MASRSAGGKAAKITARITAKTAATTSRSGAAPRAWQRMLSGRRLDLLDPSPLDIEIEAEEIARRRTGGVDRRLTLALLLHDAPEYVIGDMISPFKVVMGGAYKAVEHRLLNAIHLRFGLPPDLPAEIVAIIKAADRGAAFLEATILAGFGAAEARRFFGPRPTLPVAAEKDYLTPWSAETAKRRFLQRFTELPED